MAVKFANLASTTLASATTNAATSITVSDASSFPSLGGSDYFYASIGEGLTSEIVKVTAVSSNTLTVNRGQDGTTAAAHSAGTVVALRVVAAALDDIASQAQTAADTESVSIDGDTMTGNLTVPNLSITSTNWLGFGDYGERISGSNANSSLTFSTDATQALLLDSSQNAVFAGDLRVKNGGRLYLWNDHSLNYIQYNHWQGSASAGMTIKNIAGTGDLILGSGNATALTLDSSQNATFAGTISSGAITSSSTLTAQTGTFTGQTGTALTVNSGATNVAAVFESTDDDVWINLKDNNSGTYGALLGHGDDALFKVADNGVNVRMLLSAAGLLDTDSGYSIGGQTVIDASREGSFATRASFGGIDSDGNNVAASNELVASGYGLMGNRGALYITNANAEGVIKFGIGGIHNATGTVALTITDTQINAGSSTIVSGPINSGAITSTGNMSLSNTGTGNSITINRTDSSSSAVFHVGSSRAYVGSTTNHIFEIRQNDSPAITIDTSGNTTVENDLVVDGNLTVSGTTTTLNTATLDVEDKNITLNYSTGDSSASANGAGITIQDAVNSTTDATILWNATDDRFDFSHLVNADGGIRAAGLDNSSAAYSGIFRNLAGSNVLLARNDGRVLIPSGYLFVQSSEGIYSTGAMVARGGITNDGGNALSISSSAAHITFNSKNLTSVGTISSGAITSTGDFSTTGSITTTDGSSTFEISGDSSSNTYLIATGEIRVRPSGTSVNKFVIGSNGDLTTAGTITSGGITSSGTITTSGSFVGVTAIVDNVLAKTSNGNILFKTNGGASIARFNNNLSADFFGSISSGNVTAGDSSTAASIRAHFSDGSYMTLEGYGLSMNRGGSYIRPTTDGDKTLYIGGADDSLDWNAIHFRSVNGLALGGTNFIDGSRNLQNIGTITSNHSQTDGFKITATDSTANASFSAMKLDYNLSGADECTTDRNHIGLHLDIDSSASGGLTNHEHRIYGIFNDVRASGDSDLVWGIQSTARVDDFGAGNQITQMGGSYGQSNAHNANGVVAMQIGGYNHALNNSSGTGQVTSTRGAYNIALAASTSDYNSATYTASHNITQISAAQTANISSAVGVWGEIQLDNDAAVDHDVTISNAFVFRAEYDENDGDDSYTVNTGYLYYGNYAGAKPTTAYGVYIANDVTNYFAGTLTAGLGSTTTASYGFNSDLNTGMYSPANHEVGFLANGQQKLKVSGTGIDVTGAISSGSITVSGEIYGTNGSSNLVIGNSAVGNIYLGGGNNNTSNIYLQTGSSVALTLNSSNNATFAGTISSGAITSTGSGVSTSPVIGITATNSATFIHASNAFAANMTAGQFHGHFFGKAGSTKNAGAIGYYWSSAGSNNNFVSMGHWGADHLLRLYGDGTVRISSGSLQMGTTTVIDSSRNLTNIGTISSGNITASRITTSASSVFSGGLETNTSQSRVKISPWTGTTYGYGMKSGMTFGGLSNNYALTFQMNSSTGRGFWWGKDGHTDAQGAMALTNDGKLTVSHSLRLGYGISDTTTPGATHALDVSGSISSGAIASNGNLTVKGTQGFNASGETASIYLGDTNSEIRATYNGGTKFFLNGTDRMEIEGGTGNLNLKTGNFEINGTTVIDSSRNATFGTTLSIGNSSGGNFVLKRPSANYIWADQTGGYLAFGGNGLATSLANSSLYFDTSKNAVFGGDITTQDSMVAAKFSDAANPTGYFVQPSAVSYFHEIRVDDLIRHNGDTNTYINFTGDRIQLAAGGIIMLDCVEGGTDYVDIIDRVRVTAGGNLECEGNITAYSTTSISDIRQKKNIEVITDPIEKIKAISGYTFDWKESGEHSGGVIAQEVENVMPSIIKETSIRDSETMKAVDYQAIIGLLVETVKDLNKRIEDLENGNN